MHEFDCDVAIVGAGAAGGVLAATLVEHGKRVVLVERGGYFTGAALVKNELAGDALHAANGSRQTIDGAIHVTGGECVGGGTLVNYALCFDPRREVWARWQRAGLRGFSFDSSAADYGIDGLNMIRALSDVRARLNVHSASSENINENNRRFANGCHALGFEARPYDLNMRDCLDCGFCGTGCSYDRKMSTAITYLPDALARGATLVHSCIVDEIVFERSGSGEPRATGLRGRVGQAPPRSRPSLARGTVEISARVVIVSSGAIETPALLQRSHVPDAADTIGRGLILHPSLPVGALYERPIENYHGITGIYYSDHYYDSHGMMLECLFDLPIDTAVAIPGVGEAHAAIMAEYRRLGGFGVMLVDTVARENRVKFNEETHAAVIAYTLAANDRARLRFGAERALDIAFAAGARRAFLCSEESLGSASGAWFSSAADTTRARALRFEPHQTLIASAHAQSTVKYGEDPRTSSANSRGEVRGTRNLIACDSSSFPTSCGVNPMISIETLARYQGLRIAGEWRRYA